MKKITFLFLLTIFLASCHQKPKEKDIVRMEMQIKGMHCEGCEQAVAGAIVSQEGAIEAFARYKDGYAVTRFDRAKLDPEVIVKAIEKKGYKVISKKIMEENP